MSMTVDAGKFTERVEVQRPDPSATPDSSGNVDLSDGDKNWLTIGPRWVKFMSQAGREFMNATQINADVTAMVEMFHDNDTKDITSAYRLKMTSGRYLNIASAYDVNEQHVIIRCLCREAV